MPVVLITFFGYIFARTLGFIFIEQRIGFIMQRQTHRVTDSSENFDFPSGQLYINRKLLCLYTATYVYRISIPVNYRHRKVFFVVYSDFVDFLCCFFTFCRFFCRFFTFCRFSNRRKKSTKSTKSKETTRIEQQMKSAVHTSK